MITYSKFVIILISYKVDIAYCSCRDGLHVQEKLTLKNYVFL